MSVQTELQQVKDAQRNPRAFAPLYDAYVGLVWNYAIARLHDEHRAADATSITFTKALAALPNFRPEVRGDVTTFRSWLMTIARNVVMDELRIRPTTSMESEAMHIASNDHSPEDLAVANDRKRQLLRAFAELSDQQQDVVRLRQQGLTGEEISRALGLSVGAVKSTHYRAIQRLKDLMSLGEEQ